MADGNCVLPSVSEQSGVHSALADPVVGGALRGWAPPHQVGNGQRIVCLINNYNYGRYVFEAVESALGQTRPFAEIIVVDDGSTDGSPSELLARYGRNPRIKLVFQDNGGQLSAFQAGLAAAAGDFVFFLDADDRFVPTKVADVMEVFESHPGCGMVCHPVALFGAQSGFDFVRRPERPAEALRTGGGDPWPLFSSDEMPAFSLGSGLKDPGPLWRWLGSPTSGMAFRRAALDRFMPLPEEMLPLWRIRADDCLVLGLAVSGNERIYLHRPLSEYRVHNANGFFNRTVKEDSGHRQATLLLQQELLRRCGLGDSFVLEKMWTCWKDRTVHPLRALRRVWGLPAKLGFDHRICLALRLRFLARFLGLPAGVEASLLASVSREEG